MLSSFAIVSHKGTVVFEKFFGPQTRSDPHKEFCQTIVKRREAQDTQPLVRQNDTTIAFKREGDMYLLITTNCNSNGALLLEMLRAITESLRVFFGKELKAEIVCGKPALLYTLLDEMMDSGYPQILDTDALQRYLNDTGTPLKVEKSFLTMTGATFSRSGTITGARSSSMMGAGPSASKVTMDVTGAVSWRQPTVSYRKNEVYLDVAETVNAVLTSTGDLVSGDVVGAVKLKCHLSGMPECKIGLNDKLSMQIVDQNRPVDSEQQRRSAVKVGGGSGVNLEGVSLHQCVRLTEFELKREISFIPPDGDFTLITYRMTENVQLPFKMTTTFKQHGRTHLEVGAVLRTLYDKTLTAYNIRIIVPVPTTTSKVQATCKGGRAKNDIPNHQVRWKFKELEGGQEASFHAHIHLISTVADKEWEKPPIRIGFDLPGFAASGLRVRFFNVVEKSRYNVHKWVRYTATGGAYEARLA